MFRVTTDGTAAVVLLPIETAAPPDGAAALSVTVACDVFPPTTLLGFKVSDATLSVEGGVIVTVVLACLPPYDAVSVTVVVLLTAVVVAIVWPLVNGEEIVIGLGTVRTDVLLLVKVTFAPENGAGSLRYTFTFGSTPPWNVEGWTVIDDTAGGVAGGVMITLALFVVPLSVPEIVAVLVEVTPEFVCTWNSAFAMPFTMVTLAGTYAAPVLLLLNETVRLPEGATEFGASVAVAIAVVPPVTLPGLMAIDASDGVAFDWPVLLSMTVVPPGPPLEMSTSALPSLFTSATATKLAPIGATIGGSGMM